MAEQLVEVFDIPAQVGFGLRGGLQGPGLGQGFFDSAGGAHLTRASSVPVASAWCGVLYTCASFVSGVSGCDGAFLTRTSGISFARASGGVSYTRTSGDPIARASGGVHCTRDGIVSSFSACDGVSCTRASGDPNRQRPVVEHFSPAPAVFHAPTDLSARAPADVHVGGLQGSFPRQSSSAHRGDEEAEVPGVTLLLRKGTDGRRYRVTARRAQPLRAVFQAHCRRSGLQASQVRFFFGELTGPLISPSDTPDLVGLEDGDVLMAEEVFEEDEEEDQDFDEIDGTWSRFPARFLFMRMCREHSGSKRTWDQEVAALVVDTDGICMTGFLACISRCVLFVGMDQKDTYAVGWLCWLLRCVLFDLRHLPDSPVQFLGVALDMPIVVRVETAENCGVPAVAVSGLSSSWTRLPTCPFVLRQCLV